MTNLFEPAVLDDRSQPDLLAEAERFVKAALDGLSAHIAILDAEGNILYVNRAWQRFADSNGFIGSNYGVGMNYLRVCDQSSAADAAPVAQGIRQVIRGDIEEFSLEYPCYSPTERRWFNLRVTRFAWRDGLRVIVAHQNITAIKWAQIELEESKRRLEAILDNLVDGIITFDETGIIESSNPAGAYLFGFERHQIVGQPIQALVPALAERPDEMALTDFIASLSDLGDELIGRRRDGTLFPMYFAVSQIMLDDRRLFTAIIQDFTERKYLESQILDKERLNIALEKERELRDLKNRFISMMSHELRTPLAAIRLANSMLKQYGDRLTEAEKRESYDAIDAQVDHLTELVNDVMTISRTDFAGDAFNPEVLDLETYCRDIIEEMQLAYRMQRSITFAGPGRRIEARIDRKLLRRAITNLLTNAIKYSPEGEPVDVELTLTDGEAVIRVSDRGIGIPPEDLKRLFEPFHRASNVGKIQGTGLGLAIARQAVELHGGSLSVESTVGVGTTFYLRLPMIDGQAAG